MVQNPHGEGLATSGIGLNDLSIEVATVNGSGSQTANKVLLRTLFQMGIPVSGKNLFPSNIAGLPTWFRIRASSKGYLAREQDVDLMICMNAETAQEDISKLQPGALVIHDDPLDLSSLRQDLRFCPVPFQQLVSAACPDAKLHKLIRNMIYVGVVAALLGLDLDEIRKAVSRQLKGKARAIELNLAAAEIGHAWALANLPPQDAMRVRRDDKTKGQIIVTGNQACALGAMFAGVTVVGWYPITPSTSLIESLEEFANAHRRDPVTGKRTLSIVQMEDELASAGIVIGAGWAGARAMTATSGPGISLMSEFIGLGYWAEIPGVFVNVQRTGPSTGLPTHTMQGDIDLCARCSHGDTLHINLYPGNAEECFRFTYDAFDLAERFQTPVFVITDLDLGMQESSSQSFDYPEKRLDRGKVLDEKGLQQIKDWGRFKDIDGDGICWRTLPGTPGGKGAFFTRGSGHNAYGHYSEKPEDYKELMDRLKRKYELAKDHVPKPLILGKVAAVAVIAYGSSDPAVMEARDILHNRYGLETAYLRLRALPFTREVGEFLGSAERVYVVEQNRDGQMLGLLRQAYPEHATKLSSVLHYDSTSIHAQTVVDQILLLEA